MTRRHPDEVFNTALIHLSDGRILKEWYFLPTRITVAKTIDGICVPIDDHGNLIHPAYCSISRGKYHPTIGWAPQDFERSSQP